MCVTRINRQAPIYHNNNIRTSLPQIWVKTKKHVADFSFLTNLSGFITDKSGGGAMILFTFITATGLIFDCLG